MKKEAYQSGRLKYAVGYPDFVDNTRKYPVIFCLHGAGSRGNDINKVFDKSFFTFNENKRNFPFILVAPLCTEDSWFDLWGELNSLVKKYAATRYIDENRMYLAGHSMGGYAAWQLGMSMPEYFAAIAPICGGGMYWNAGRLADVPVWAFHGAKDTVVKLEESQKMVDAVIAAGGDAKLTVYPEAAHNSWDETYSDPKLYEWFLSHDKAEKESEDNGNLKIDA